MTKRENNRFNVALATNRETPTLLDKDDDHLLAAINSRTTSLTYNIVPWGDYTINNAYDVTLIRSTWDYHTAIDSFLKWSSDVTNLLNSSKIVTWNCNKRYLEELRAVVHTIPSVYIVARDDNGKELLNTLRCQNWPMAVLKPTISLGSLDTIILKDYDVHNAIKLFRNQRGREFLVQPFIEDIRHHGEISLIYIDGEFSHAVKKVPKEGDFRSQPEFASTVTAIIPEEIYKERAEKVLQFVHDKFTIDSAIHCDKLLYARVDFIAGNDPYLIELEAIEPCLYFDYCINAATKLVDALIKRLNKE